MHPFAVRPVSLRLLLLATAAIAPGQAIAAPPPLSPAWFASRPATGGQAAASSAVAGTAIPTASINQVQQSLAGMQRSAAAIRAADSAQTAARALANLRPSIVPNGLTPGGLWVPAGTVAGGPTWTGAALPTQTAAAGRQRVTVRQSQSTATLTWQTFNVGQQTDLVFDQSAGGSAASTWSVLNRVSDPSANPSQILGTITAPGQVLVINRNGVVFSGTSVVNVGALVASTANIADTAFRTSGIYGSNFGSPGGAITVQAGALIATAPPASPTVGGGSVILLGSAVENDGSISAPAGQVAMAAGQSFVLRPGYAPAGGATGSQTSTTLGTEIAVTRQSTSAPTPDAVINTGLIESSTGDVSLVGNTLVQNGTILSTSSATQRGTIHFFGGTVTTAGANGNTYAVDPTASITFGPSSLTQIDNDPSTATALISQRQGLIDQQTTLNTLRGSVTNPAFIQDLLPTTDRLDLSRIEITAGGSADVQSGALIRSVGGQIVTHLSAPAGATHARFLVESGAMLDVGGSLDVTEPATALALPVTIQGFEIRDSAANRDSGTLFNSKVTVDVTQLVLVPSGTGGYVGDRYYTGGGLLEISGELGNVGYTNAQFTTAGGAVTVTADQVVTQPGAVVNLTGGSVRYQPGLVPTTYLVTTDGRIININQAPADLTYSGVYNGFVVNHTRWGVTQTFRSALVAPSMVEQQGFSVGANAGSLTINAPTAILAASIAAGTVVGERQTGAPSATASLSSTLTRPSTTVPLGGTVSIGPYGTSTAGSAAAGTLSFGAATPSVGTVTIADGAAASAAAIGAGTALPAALRNQIAIDASQLSAAGLGGLSVAVNGPLTISSPVTLGNGATVALSASSTSITAPLTARSGAVSITDYVTNTNGVAVLSGGSGTTPVAVAATLSPGAVIDTRGLFTNGLIDPSSLSGEAFVNGGSVTIDVASAAVLSPGSTIDASSGAAVLTSGALYTNATTKSSGTGGNITILTYDPGLTPNTTSAFPATPLVQVGADLRSTGVTRGGALTVAAPQVVVAATDPALVAAAGPLTVGPGSFAAGFSSYTLIGYQGVTVAAGASITPTSPVFQLGPNTLSAPTGTETESALVRVLPPVYAPIPQTATLQQRAGASVRLSAGVLNASAPGVSEQLAATTFLTAAPLTVGAGASIAVDPGQSIELDGTGQTTVLGSLTAHGGSISIKGSQPIAPISTDQVTIPVPANYFGSSIYVGDGAALDVSAVAATALDARGRPYGVVPAGGSVVLGSANTNLAARFAATNLFVVVRPGATINASGTQAMIDTGAGVGGTALTSGAAGGLTEVGSSGGGVTVGSMAGIYLDGSLTATAGNASAMGGTLSVTLATPVFQTSLGSPLTVIQAASSARPRDITVSPVQSASALPANVQPGDASSLVIGTADLSANAIVAAGIDQLALAAGDRIVFNGSVSLGLGRSLSLTAGALATTNANSTVSLSAPRIELNGLPDNSFTRSAQLGGTLPNNGGDEFPTAPPVPTQATLALSGNVIDFTGLTNIGSVITVSASNLTNGGSAQVFALPGFAQATISSSGDVRFLPSNAANQVPSGLLTPGDVTVIASQLYPTSSAAGEIVAGYDPTAKGSNVFRADGTLTILRAGGAGQPLPAMPLSVGGSLVLDAGVVNQDGVVRAPLGQITLGQLGLSTAAKSTTSAGMISAIYTPPVLQTSSPFAVNFAPGSVTSVSAAGLTTEVGGTPDGLSYSLLGLSVSITGSQLVATSSQSTQPRQTVPTTPTLTVLAQSVDIQQGAVVDLSGGGTLAGAGFVSGRGGSVNPLTSPLLQFPSTGTSTASSSNQVFAVIPGFSGYAPPAVTSNSAATPSAGAQITLTSAIQGLPAGTYTLLPAEDALLPGAYRVEMTISAQTPLAAPISIGNGSSVGNGFVGIQNTSIQSATPLRVTVTSGATVRSLGQFNEETYSQFVAAQAALFNARRFAIPADAGTLYLGLIAPSGSSTGAANTVASRHVQTLTVDGSVLFTPDAGGQGGTADVAASSGGTTGTTSGDQPAALEVTVSGQPVVVGAVGVAAGALNALQPATLSIGGYEFNNTATGGAPSRSFTPGLPQSYVSAVNPIVGPSRSDVAQTSSVTIGAGASVSAGAVELIAGSGGITIDAGAQVTTIGHGAPAEDPTGLTYTIGSSAATVLLAANASLTTSLGGGAGPLNIGTCTASCTGPASLFTSGTLAFASAGVGTLDPRTLFGAQSLQIAEPSINIGTDTALAAATASGTLPLGLTLTQSVLTGLLAGNAQYGTPALQSLVLQASTSVNLFGPVVFNTIDPATGRSSLNQFELDTPAITGVGGAGDVARIITGNLTWNGIQSVAGGVGGPSLTAPTVVAGGIGSGTGAFEIDASQIVLGYAAGVPSQTQFPLGRTLLGFSTSTLNASGSILFNSNGALSAPSGALALEAPLLSSGPGATLAVSAAGPVAITPPSGAGASVAASTALGATLSVVSSATIEIGSAIVLPSSQVTLTAANGITVDAGGRIDLSAPSSAVVNQTRGSPGGALIASTVAGGIDFAPGSTVDVSAGAANAGSVSLTAQSGTVTLGGRIMGVAPTGSLAGQITVSADAFDVAATNATLDAGGFFGARNFDLRTGNLTISGAMRAETITLAADAGAVTIDGTLDASGPAPGTIRLSGATGLTLGAQAVLDAHGTVLQTDSTGAAIDAENTGTVELDATGGTLAIASGARIDLTTPDGIARGRITLNAPRTADGTSVMTSAQGGIAVAGASSIVLNAVRAYADTSATGLVQQAALAPGATGVSLTAINADSAAFMAAAVANAALGTQIVGLSALQGFELRPGVEIDSTSASGGNLTVSGDLNLASFRYSAGPYGQSVTSGVYGSGEPMSLVLRAANTLAINGSITDGFGLPPEPTGAINPDETGFTNRPKVTVGGVTQSQGLIYATASLLSAGTKSASIRLVSGADLAAADTRAVQPTSAIATGGGNLVLNDPHVQEIVQTTVTTTTVTTYNRTTLQPTGSTTTTTTKTSAPTPGDAVPSVIRTGTGNLDLIAGGNFSELSPFGIYTAGAQSAGVSAAYNPARTNSPEQTSILGSTIIGSVGQPRSGRVTTTVQSIDYRSYEQLVTPASFQTGYATGGGNVLISAQGSVTGDVTESAQNAVLPASNVGAWLWRQGGSGSGLPTAWSVNFGTYGQPLTASGSTVAATGILVTPVVEAPVGFFTLGGGNLTVIAGGNAGAIAAPGSNSSTALVLGVGSSGRVDPTTGALIETGGGALSLKVGGALNGGVTAISTSAPIPGRGASTLNGAVTNLRGPVSIAAGSIGNVKLIYSTTADDPRSPAADFAGIGNGAGGPVLVLGDSTANLTARGSLVLAGVGDPTRLAEQNSGQTSFSLWQPTTSVSLLSDGGNLVVDTQPYDNGVNDFPTDLRFLLPPIVLASAPSGNIYLPTQPTGNLPSGAPTSIELAPSPVGQLALVAGGSVIGGSAVAGAGGGTALPLDISGAPLSTTTSIADPLFNATPVIAIAQNANNNLFAFGADTASANLHANDTTVALIEAAGGDVLDGSFGQIITTIGGVTSTTYIAAKPFRIVAGRDVVGGGTLPGQIVNQPPPSGATNDSGTGNLFLNVRPTDVSSIEAGRDIIYANADISGPGTLYVQAGRNITQQNKGALESIGPSGPNGAGITVLAGVGAAGPDYAAFAATYFNDANLANSNASLTATSNAGRVAETYGAQLLAYMQSNYGYAGDQAGALAAFLALPTEQQAPFVLQIYFSELTLSGREFTNASSVRFKSYARGREAIATLFPATGTYNGALTLFPSAPTASGASQSGSLIRTDFGGTVTLLSPGGGVSLGTNTLQTPGGEGVITRGAGNIDVYALDSILLGTSRIFTTGGGNIVIWSAQGDINAGRGASSTGTFSPIQVTYARNGSIVLSPSTATTGAGIATLAPIAGVPPGNVDLIAPLGTIDAGEAGIRVSGNVNLAALVVTNAANVSASGTTTGVAVVAAPNVAAIASASASGAASSQAAQQSTRAEQTAQQTPSNFTVEVSGLVPSCGPGQQSCR